MEIQINLIKKSLLESFNQYEKYKKSFQKIFFSLKSNQKYTNNIIRYFDFEKEENYFRLLFLLFFQHEKWINPYKINIRNYLKHFKYKRDLSHDQKEELIVNNIDKKNIMKIYIYWHLYILIELSMTLEEENKNNLNIIDIENILFQNNRKIVNLFKSKKINTQEIFIFLYIYIFWIEYFVENNSHEKSLKLINNILFTLLFELLEKIAEIIFSDSEEHEKTANNINLFFSFLDEIKSNEFINNDYNFIILIDCNIIQNFMINLLKNINVKILETIFPSYLIKLTDFFAYFFKFRFNKSKLIDFFLNNIKTGLINLKYLETEQERIMNDVFLQNFQSDLIQKIFSYEDKRLQNPNFNSFLFNGNNSKISLNLTKISLNDNLILFSFLIKPNINDNKSYNIKQTLFCFYNKNNECLFEASIKRAEQKETVTGDKNNLSNVANKFHLIIKIHNEKEKIIKEFNYLEVNITYFICFHLNNSFVNIYLYPTISTNQKIIHSHSEIKYNFQEEIINLNIGFINNKEKTGYFSGYIGYFHIIQLFNPNKNKIDIDNIQIIINRILLLKEYYQYLIFYLKNNESEIYQEISLDYIARYKNKNEMIFAKKILEFIKKESKNLYKIILFLSPDLFKLSNFNENIDIKKFVIPHISGICEKQKEYRFNDINITFVRFEKSKEVFLMKNGLNLFCFQFEYLFQFANYYILFFNKIQQSDNISGEVFYEENKETFLNIIKSVINNILLIIYKYIIDLKITNFFPELKQIFSNLLEAINSLNNIGCIIDSIFHQLSGLFIIICEQLPFLDKIINDNNENKVENTEKNENIKFLIGLRDSIIDILLTKTLYNNVSPKFFESLFDRITSIIESNNSMDITKTHPNIFLKVLSFCELLINYIMKFQPNLLKDVKNMKKNNVVSLYFKLLKVLINGARNNNNENVFLKQLISFILKELINNYHLSYIFLQFVMDLLNEGISFEENEINELIKYLNIICNIEPNDDFQESERNNISKLVISIILKCIFEKNKDKNFFSFCNEIKQMDLNDILFSYIINEILNLFSTYMDSNNSNIIINIEENTNKRSRKVSNASYNPLDNFDYINFFDNLFDFILILINKYFSKKDFYLNINTKNKEENQKISNFEITNTQIKPNLIIQELINLIFFIEEMINAHINNKTTQITTILSLLNLIKLMHILVLDDKLIELFNEDKFTDLFKSLIESCIKSKIIYTNFYINPYEKSLLIQKQKTIPEALLDILMKLIKSDLIKYNKDENKVKENKLIKNDIIFFLNEIFLINIKTSGIKEGENKRSLFCYNDLYRYFFSKKITNVESELKSINKKKDLTKNFNKFGDDFIYLYNINNILSGKIKQFNFNFITFNLEKIYRYKLEIDSLHLKELNNFYETILDVIIKENEILYKIDKNFFFKTNSDYPNYNKIKNKIEPMISTSKVFETIDLIKYLDLEFGNKSIGIEYINSGLCEIIKEPKNKKTKSKNELNKTRTDIYSSEVEGKKYMRSSTELGTSPGEILCNVSKSAQNEDNHSIHLRTSSFVSSDIGSEHNEDAKSHNESFSNKSQDSLDDDSSSYSYHTSSGVKIKKGLPSINNSYLSLLSADPNMNKNYLYSSNSSNIIIDKKQLEDDINCNFLNKLDSIYLFNVKRDLIKNIFSLNFLDTIFYDKTFLELKKLFYQEYEPSLESVTKTHPTLNYPTKIKNFSNGVEPSLFLSPYQNFYSHKNFHITHEYFNQFITNNKKQFKNESINLIEKRIFIPTKERIHSYNCELIKINKAYFGNITYSKTSSFLYFEQRNFEEIYNKNLNTYKFDGIFSLSAIKLRDKETSKPKKIKKIDKLYHKNKKVLILLNEIEEIVERRFLLMWQGLEIYLKDGRSYFFNLLHPDKYKKFMKHLLEEEENIRQIFHRKEFLTKDKYITKAWENGNITTYEYLLFINKYASRSFNDPAQYYVFPWIVSKFDNLILINENKDILSNEKYNKNIDRENEENDEEKTEEQKLIDSLRELKYPLSQQNEMSRSSSISKYSDDDSKDFHFHLGTHYSTPPFIYYYLMRQEPYNTLLIKLQNYQRENPNRMFLGLKETIDILETGNDNRELIPEFFSKIEFFLNLNYSYYGMRATKKIVNNVRIDFMKKDPDIPIQISDYIHFIIEHRNVLNSNLINLNINDWLNNIFGLGQLPKNEKNKKDSCNIFRKVTYEQYNNLIKKINRYKTVKKLSTKEIRIKILNKENLMISFGQTPYQVFREPLKAIKNQKENDNINSNNGLSYKKQFRLDDNEEDDDFASVSNILRPSKYQARIKYPCIYFDINEERNKIFALSQNKIVEINFALNNGNDSDILVLSYQNEIKVHRIKLFKNFSLNEVEYYVYKPKYSFSSFKGCEYVDLHSRKGSKISKDSKNINSDKDFNFNNYYTKLFQSMYMRKNIDNQLEEDNKFIQCRYLDNSFKIYKITKIKNPKKKQQKMFVTSFSYLCEDFVSSCCTISLNQFLTGLDNGKLIRWNIIKEERDKIKINFDKNIQAHRGRINAIEIDQRLGLIITCGKDNLVQIRKLFNLELITPIKIKKKYIIVMAKISPINFLYILCFDIEEIRSVIYGYTLTGIKFAKNKGGLYTNIDFTRSGNIVSLLDNKELCILNAYDLTKRENISKKMQYKDDLKELENIKGASWLEFIYFIKKPDSDGKNKINNAILYVKKSKNKDENNMIFYYNFKENQIFE